MILPAADREDAFELVRTEPKTDAQVDEMGA
jgi:hypothetical protein